MHPSTSIIHIPLRQEHTRNGYTINILFYEIQKYGLKHKIYKKGVGSVCTLVPASYISPSDNSTLEYNKYTLFKIQKYSLKYKKYKKGVDSVCTLVPASYISPNTTNSMLEYAISFCKMTKVLNFK